MAWPLIAAMVVSSYMQSRQKAKSDEEALAMQGYGIDTSAATQKYGYDMMKKLAYPGQKEGAEKLAPYLTERIGEGLSPEEMQVYRGEGQGAISAGLKSVMTSATKSYASQGLKGGAVASGLRQIQEARFPAVIELENQLKKMDLSQKNLNISQLLQYLGLSAGHEAGSEAGASTDANAGGAGGAGGPVSSYFGTGDSDYGGFGDAWSPQGMESIGPGHYTSYMDYGDYDGWDADSSSWDDDSGYDGYF